MKLNISCLLVFLGFASVAEAHSNFAQKNRKDLSNRLTASAAVTFREDSSVEKDAVYRIPGNMLGGEAIPAEKGFQFDDFMVNFSRTFDDRYRVSGEVGLHGVTHEAQLEIQKFWFSLPITDLKQFEIDMGKMTTLSTPTASWHASRSLFSEAPLLSDIFFGRHFHDTGVRFHGSVSDNAYAGLELWQGDSWPASPGERSYVAYLNLNRANETYRGEVQLWGLSASPEDRQDDRYEDGHHGAIESTTSSFLFSGDLESFGLFARTAFRYGNLSWLAHVEWIQQQTEGDLERQSESSRYQSTVDGWRWVLSGEYRAFTVSAQYEQMSVESVFKNAVSTTFISDSGLFIDGYEPYRFVTNVTWQFIDDLSFRFEYTVEELLEDRSNQRFSLGLVWLKDWRLDGI